MLKFTSVEILEDTGKRLPAMNILKIGGRSPNPFS